MRGRLPKRGESRRAVEDVWPWVRDNFPFDGYIKVDRKESYIWMAQMAHHLLEGRGQVLDFGAGPGDKTAMFARAGLTVTAFDDFEDPWHKLPGNREKILEFAANAGITYVAPTDGTSSIPDLGGPFDMVMLHHVLEHLHESPRRLVNSLLDNLREGGWLFVTVPNAVNLRKRLAVASGRTNYPPYSQLYWYPGRSYRGHIREYVTHDLRSLATQLGLEQASVGNYNHFWHAVPRRLRPGVRLLCWIVPSFSDSCYLVARKPIGWEPRSELSPAELSAALGKGEYFDYSQVKSGEISDT